MKLVVFDADDSGPAQDQAANNIYAWRVVYNKKDRKGWRLGDLTGQWQPEAAETVGA